MDVVSQDGEHNLENELRESHSTVNQCTHQIKELQQVANSLSESQVIKDFETVSSSGSAHAPGTPLIHRCFHVSFVATVIFLRSGN